MPELLKADYLILRRIHRGERLSLASARKLERRGDLIRQAEHKPYRRTEFGREVGPRLYVYALSSAACAKLAAYEAEREAHGAH